MWPQRVSPLASESLKSNAWLYQFHSPVFPEPVLVLGVALCLSVTANGRSDVINPSRYVFNRARVVSNGAGIGTVTLGRPWGNFSRVTFQNSYLSEVVNPVGWSSWKVADERTNHAKYNEYNNHGPGAILFPSGYNTTSKASRSSINNGTTGSGEKGGAPIVQNATTLGVPPSARADFSYNLKRPYVVSQLLGKVKWSRS